MVPYAGIPSCIVGDNQGVDSADPPEKDQISHIGGQVAKVKAKFMQLCCIVAGDECHIVCTAAIPCIVQLEPAFKGTDAVTCLITDVNIGRASVEIEDIVLGLRCESHNEKE